MCKALFPRLKRWDKLKLLSTGKTYSTKVQHYFRKELRSGEKRGPTHLGLNLTFDASCQILTKLLHSFEAQSPDNKMMNLIIS